MNKEQVLEAWKTLKPLPSQLVSYILRKAIKTGTRAFKIASPDSDLDFMIKGNKALNFNSIVANKYGVYLEGYSGDFQSVYVKFPQYPNPVNLLIFNDEASYEVMVKATELMASLAQSNPTFASFLKHKGDRIHLFEAFKDYFEHGEDRGDKGKWMEFDMDDPSF